MNLFNRVMNQKILPFAAGLEKLYARKSWRPRMDEAGTGAWFERIEGEVQMSMKPDEWSVEKWNSFCEYSLRTGPAAKLAACWCYAGLVGEGPKIYCPTAEECRAFANVAATIQWRDYRQPFDTMTIILPENLVFDPVPLGGRSRPAAIVSRYNHEEAIWTVSILCDGREELTSFVGIPDEECTLEQKIANSELDEKDEHCLVACRRIAANACQLLVQAGGTRLGKANPEHARKLEAAAKKKLPSHVARQNSRALRMIPEVYGFNQTIKIYDEAKEEGDTTSQAGYQVKPHYRRGYWQRQVCGEGGKDRILQFRRPCLVNAHLLKGKPIDTHVTLVKV